ncbi:MAG: inorganic phosphate transporter [Saprospiraceae bacterium]|nr:inorganic phosphate transporter [Saprospiraceae bacterium]
MTLGFIAGLSSEASIMLLVCLLAVCFFEAINGFHDTANAVATVIYTKTLPPVFAVIWSGCWNFLGALLGGVGVAMGIIKLMPLNDMLTVPLGENIAMVMAILLSAITWNLSTWYFGIPCSSSHTLIGSLLGGGFAFWTVHAGSGPNWAKAADIGMSLLISPLFGFSLAILLMFILRTSLKRQKTIFKSPDDTKKTPPMWIRAILVTTCTLVSYFHGNNDGQKGVGLLLVVMIAFLPVQFAMDPKLPAGTLAGNVRTIEQTLSQAANTSSEHAESLRGLATKCTGVAVQLDSTDMQNKAEVFAARKALQGLNKNLDSSIKGGIISGNAAHTVKAEIKHLTKSYEFSPIWVVALIAFCLGLGTMIGWKRIVVTIGEKIGKTHLTYAQGASAELCAAATIGVSSAFALPVSTTHVLSSGIAGTMVAQGGVANLRKKTITNIALAWLMTLPVTMLLSALLYFLFRLFV